MGANTTNAFLQAVKKGKGLWIHIKNLDLLTDKLSSCWHLGHIVLKRGSKGTLSPLDDKVDMVDKMRN